MSLTNKTIAATYKDLLHLNNTNLGLTGTSKAVVDGLGNSTGLHLSTNKIIVKPSSNGVDSFSVQTSTGTDIFQVDTANSAIKVGASLLDPTIGYYEFVVNDFQPTAPIHSPIGSGANDFEEQNNFGILATPNTAFTSSNNAYKLVDKFWYMHDNIKIESIRVFFASDNAASEDVRFHVMSYDINSDLDLSNGLLIADGADIENAGYEQGYYQDLTINATNSAVTSGKVVMAFIQPDGATGDFYIKVSVKYKLN